MTERQDESVPSTPRTLAEQREEKLATGTGGTAAAPTFNRNTGSRRKSPWILLGVAVGLLLPLCACLVVGSASFFSMLAAIGGGDSTRTIGTGPAVAIVRVEGIIVSDDDPAAGASSGVIIEEIERAAADDSIKAIVLRVDSPGGTVTGSAQIYEALLELKKPVVVSMGATAASGGYYVSAPAAYIFARPDTITGSIGVIYTLYNVEELLDELGVEIYTITSGPNKDIGGLWEEPTPEQIEIFEQLVAESYDEFVRIIARGRPELTEEEVRALADGRIYSGRQALALDLVDELGDLEEATTKAAELGGISGEPRIVEYERIPTFTELFLGLNSRLTDTETERLLEAMEVLTTPSLQYRYMGPGLE